MRCEWADRPSRRSVQHFSDAGVSQSPVEWATYPSLRWHRPLATMAPASRGRPLVSLQPLCSISALADFLKRHFEATKFLRTQFREHSLHLPGMLSKG